MWCTYTLKGSRSVCFEANRIEYFSCAISIRWPDPEQAEKSICTIFRFYASVQRIIEAKKKKYIIQIKVSWIIILEHNIFFLGRFMAQLR